MIQNKIIQIQNNTDSISKKSIEIEKEIKPMLDSVKKIEGNIQQISTISGHSQIKIEQMAIKNDETQNKISSIVDKLNQISQKCSITDKCIQQIPNKINSIEDDAKKIFNKVCINLGISLASIKSFKGIIRQLTDECGGNVSDKNIVNVTASSECDEEFDEHYAKDAVDFDDILHQIMNQIHG